MAYISINDMSVEFKLYGVNSRSLKNNILSRATGGFVAKGADDSISVKALNKISLKIKDGDRVGLVGHNGAGKSTLLRVLSGIYRPSSGTVSIFGSVGALLDPMAGMDGESTGMENIYLRGFMIGMSRQQIFDRIDDILAFTELGEFINLPVKTYSAGMFSRLAFAISTSFQPEILLIDEGIGAGDAAFQEKASIRVQSLVDKVHILMLASHNESLIQKMCTKKIEFFQGNITSIKDIER